MRDAESLRPDHDAQHQLEHDHWQEQTASARDGGDRPATATVTTIARNDPVSTVNTFGATSASNTDISNADRRTTRPPIRVITGPTSSGCPD